MDLNFVVNAVNILTWKLILSAKHTETIMKTYSLWFI